MTTKVMLRILGIIYKEHNLPAYISSKVSPNQTLLSVHLYQCQTLLSIPSTGLQVMPVINMLLVYYKQIYGTSFLMEGKLTPYQCVRYEWAH